VLANDGVGFDEDKRGTPPELRPSEHRPEAAIAIRDSGSVRATLVDGELLAQREVLEEQIAS
jgi:hypothetical protein